MTIQDLEITREQQEKSKQRFISFVRDNILKHIGNNMAQ